MLSYGRQDIDEDDVAAVVAALRGDTLTGGPAVAAFEASVREHSGAAYAVAVSNGTAALRLLYQVAGVGPGVRVGVPAITFVATASQAMLLGAEVVLLDVDPDTLLLTPEILAACPHHLDVVVAVHMAGRLCDMAGLAAVAERRGIMVLEDAAHAFGSTWNDGGQAGDGRYSRGAIFSFHPVKNITTAEGGAVVVADPDWDASLRSLRHHGVVREAQAWCGPAAIDAPWYHEFQQPASNERLSDLHAALGVSQCRRLAAFKRRRAEIVARYRRVVADHPALYMATAPIDQQPFWHLAQVHCDWDVLACDRRELFARAHEAGIALQVHYIPLCDQPLLAAAAGADACHGARQGAARVVALPCHPGLADQDINQVEAFCRGLA
ncbi:MAG: DegT/DnrJ/EryC1/StrS family aminotransferase [Planctomycetota bacterium]|jgi:dTDP-4-amino-4,6-dideoxygalactose transaminase